MNRESQNPKIFLEPNILSKIFIFCIFRFAFFGDLRIINYMGNCIKKLENYFAKHTVPTFRDKPSPVSFNFYDTMCILVISFVSLMIRFWAFFNPYGITSIEIPSQFYIQNQFTYSRNSFSQPLGNILYSFFAAISYNDDIYDINKIELKNYLSKLPNSCGNETIKYILNFLNEDSQITLRAISSLFSSFVPIFLFISIKLASFSRISAFLSSFLLIFDTSMLCEGRFLHPSGFIYFFIGLSLCFLTYWFSLHRNNEKWQIYMITSSIVIGFTVSIKSSAYFLIFIVYFHETIYLFIENDSKLSKTFFKSTLKRCVIFTLPIIAIHLFFCFLQFIFKHQFTFEDFEHQISEKKSLFFTTFRLILNNCIYVQNYNNEINPFIVSKKITFNRSLNSTNPLNWILISKLDESLWTNCNRDFQCERVVFIGNFFIYIFAILGVFLVILFKSNRKYFRSSTFYLGYLFSFLPYLFLSSVLNFNLNTSDYLIPLMFGVACFGISIDIIVGRFGKGFFTIVAISFAIAGFKLWSPFVFSEKLSKNNTKSRLWFDSWKKSFGIE